jgi:hypothetical protein
LFDGKGELVSRGRKRRSERETKKSSSYKINMHVIITVCHPTTKKIYSASAACLLASAAASAKEVTFSFNCRTQQQLSLSII